MCDAVDSVASAVGCGNYCGDWRAVGLNLEKGRFTLYLKKKISKSLEKKTVKTVRLSASVNKIYEIYLKDEYINIKILIIYSLVIL